MPRWQPKESRPANRLSNEPIRTCAGCRARREKSGLVRVARLPGGDVAIEEPSTGPIQGRGAYVCPEEACVLRALRPAGFKRVLRIDGELPLQVGERLLELVRK